MKTLFFHPVFFAGLIFFSCALYAQEKSTNKSKSDLIKSVKDASTKFIKKYGSETLFFWSENKISPSAVLGLKTEPSKGSPESIARNFLSDNLDIFLIPDENLHLLKVESSSGGFVARFSQIYKGFQIYGRTLTVKMDKTLKINAVHSDCDPLPDFQPEKKLSWEQAVKKAYAECLDGKKLNPPENLLATEKEVKMIFAGDPYPKLAFRIPLLTVPLIENFICYIDAKTGEVILVENKRFE